MNARQMAPSSLARHPRREAQQMVGDGFDARVLEPSPPAVLDGEWFADDPVAVGPLLADPVVSPVAGAELTWDEWLRAHPADADWVAPRWLGAYRRLPPAPERLAESRLALHRLAVYVVSPARRRANTKIGLRWTMGGFGTPFFGDEEQVRVAGSSLIRQRAGAATDEAITTLSGAAAFALDGPPDLAWAEGFDVPSPGDPDAELEIDGDAAGFLGDWYGFAVSVLETLRAEPASADPSRVQLWPEHFDLAFDCLSDERHRRATFGASPGDANIAEPYLYVGPWYADEVAPSEHWNAKGFRGAALALSDFVGEADQRAAALAFYRDCRALLEH